MDEGSAKAERLPGGSIRRGDRERQVSGGDANSRAALLDRHNDAVRRYLRDVVADPDVAEALFQDFAQVVRRDDLPPDSPPLGHFRDRLRIILIRLVEAHRGQGEGETSRPPATEGPDPNEQRQDESASTRFDAIWREELLNRSWSRLKAHEERTAQPLYTTLRYRVEAPGLSSPELAERIGQQLGKTISPPNARQLLHRARAEFSRLLLDEVLATLPPGAPFAVVERELIETGLLAFCREAVDRVRPSSLRRR
jgi:DNA-directed RNA polymerase specialized sigma24 family protein